MRVLYLASEVTPLSKTGGLGDVAGALPRALAEAGVDIVVVSARYGFVNPKAYGLAKRLRTLPVTLGENKHEVGIYEGTLPQSKVPLYLIDHPESYDRDEIYGEHGVDYPDNARRFALLSRAGLELGQSLGNFDIVHANDWQSALALFYIKRDLAKAPGQPAGVLTIHNLAFLGLFPRATVDELGLGWEAYTAEGLEFHDQVSFLKAGIVSADRITTVSPRYAREIQLPELGCGLEGLLSQNRTKLVGLLNGVDYDEWNPEHDRHIAARYSVESLSAKGECKRALQQRFGLPVRPEVPLFGAVSRLTEQKGFNLVVGAADELTKKGAQLAILGTGDSALETALRELARRHPTQIAVRIVYDNAIAHEVEAGADFFLMPSRFEPCGLNQMYSLRYGTLPIVRATGGLDDTVVDWDPKTRTGTGFKFVQPAQDDFLSAIRRAMILYRDREALTAARTQAMRQNYSWAESARKYRALYDDVVQARGGHQTTTPRRVRDPAAR